MARLIAGFRQRRLRQPLLTFASTLALLCAITQPVLHTLQSLAPGAARSPSSVPDEEAPAGSVIPLSRSNGEAPFAAAFTKLAKKEPRAFPGSKASQGPPLGGEQWRRLLSTMAVLTGLGLATMVAASMSRKNSGSTSAGTMADQTVTVVLPVLAAFVGWIAIMYAIQHSILALPFLPAAHAVYFPVVATFVVGYLFIVLEEQTKVNKAATALVLGVMTWVFVATGLDLAPDVLEKDIKDTLQDVSEVVFFVLGALTIVEIMDAHKGFDIITKAISAKRSRELMVVIGILTFALSSVLNNLTVVIVMVSLLQKVVEDEPFRRQLGGIIVVASNAGGAWTPIGDITTTMLYIGGQVTTVPLIGNLFFPSVLCLVGTLGYEYVRMEDKEFERPWSSESDSEPSPNGQAHVFWCGLIGMTTVPVFTALTACPAWCGMMLVLGILGVITSILHGKDERYNLKGALARVEVSDALFFLGVLFAVGALERVGILKAFEIQLSSLIPSDAIVAIFLGFASAVVDNVPLVAATQGMYDISAHPANDPLWNLITYCAATGGSLLIIGSASGVAFMGMEKSASFGWYVQSVAPAALVGYFAGVGGMLLQQGLGLALK